MKALNLNNVDMTIYDVFNKVCEKLGYNPNEHKEGRGINSLKFLVETTWIDSGEHILRRDLYHNGMSSWLEIVLCDSNEIVSYDYIRKKIFGINPAVDAWWLYSKLDEVEEINQKYNKQIATEEQINKVIDELVNFLTS